MASIIGTIENDLLVGTEASDDLSGLDGNDTLNGGAGLDTLVGGAGHDVYYVDRPEDVIFELADEGIDLVQSFSSYTLPDNVEQLLLFNTTGGNLQGNELDNLLHGNSSADNIWGYGGNDTLVGGAGNDTLDGGAGVDSAAYHVPRSDYGIVRVGDNAYEVALLSTNEVDKLCNLEFVDFVLRVSGALDFRFALTTGGVAVSDETPNAGEELFVHSTLANSQNLEVTNYQWQYLDSIVGWTDIAAATQPGFTPGSAQIGQQLRVRVSFTDTLSAGQLAFSQATAAVSGTPPSGTAPVITSNGGGASATLNVAENTTAVTTVTVTDADLPAQDLTYSLSGADAARFTINASGVLSFASAPDFETPSDAGANNAYDVIVTVSDGSLSDSQTLAITVTDGNESIDGTSGNDNLVGTINNDIISGFAGNDALDGGPGPTPCAVASATIPTSSITLRDCGRRERRRRL